MKKSLLKSTATRFYLCICFFTANMTHAQQVSDKDGNLYDVVQIGNLKWLKQNLKVTKYNNGDLITTGLTNSQWSSTTQGAYAYPNDAEVNKVVYGLLYNAYAVTDPRGLAPEGWRVATDEDWKDLEIAVGLAEGEVNSPDWRGVIAPILKANSYSNGLDSYGFSVMPAGVRDASGIYNYFASHNTPRAAFWTSTPSATQEARYLRRLFRGGSSNPNNDNHINRSNWHIAEGYSIRCVQDVTTPVNLIDFLIKSDGMEIVKISWSTASELNNDFFEIERSTDGKVFTAITKIRGMGTSNSVQKYHFEDKNPFLGINYYRLKQVDFDGKTTIHGVRFVNFKLQNLPSVSVSPNPSHNNNITLNLTNFGDNKVTVYLIGVDGSLWHTEEIRTDIANNNYPLNIKKILPKGQYVVKIKSVGIEETVKLIVL